MSGLFLYRADAHGLERDPAGRAADEFRRQGLARATPVAVPGWHGFHLPYMFGGLDMMLTDGDDMVAAAGTIVVDGLMGRAALAALLRDADPLELDWSRLAGQFVVLLRRAGRSFLFTDYFGAFQLFHDDEARVFSTSLLATLDSLRQVSFDLQGVYEYAFNAIPIGDATVFGGIRTLGPDRIVELMPDGVRFHPVSRPLPDTPVPAPLSERIERHRARLDTVIAPYVAAFGDRIACPLSGGLDSRLVLAALRAAGAAPSLYVYGPAGSADVAVSRAIGAAEGTPVDWIDKSELTIAPDAFPARVAEEFHRLDGLPNYGNIFDAGGNAAASAARHEGGRLAASGGCGEIYRDFFFLADRPASPRAVARAFFARFLRSDTTPLFDPGDFIAALAVKIGRAVDAGPDERLPRGRVEHLYPKVRCRSLFGREISMEARSGPYLMPFLDHRVVAEAMTLPMRLKHAGRFEAQLLNAIDPVLAARPSAYGHDFTGAPSRRHRFDEWSSRVRPVWLRQRSYAIARRRRPMSDDNGGLMSAEYLPRVVDPAYPAMRRYFAIDAITDSGLMRRIACLEYCAAWLGSKLAA